MLLTMSTSLRITGAIDRAAPDPSAPSEPRSTWIGLVQVSYDLESRSAAILKVNTGRGVGDLSWGSHVLVLRWIGDPPPPEVAQAVYDLIRDGGPKARMLGGSWIAQPRSEAQPSYRAARA